MRLSTLWAPECKFAEFEIGYCCGGGEEAMAGFLSPRPTSDDPDLYFEKITYTGWDITNIKYGGDCTWGIMSNDFTYDKNHRVTAMNSGVFNPHATNANYSTSYQYDPAGNIRELTRKGLMPDGTTYDLIDDLRYEYASERLQTVDDLTDIPKGFKPTFSKYTYDPNGNVIYDDGKGLEIQVNPINLPKLVTQASTGATMKLHYTFGGEKIKQEVQGTGADDEIRLYIGGVEFVQGFADAYYHGEGRVFLKDGQTRFQYKITDHLGDLAVFFEDKNNDGDIETEEETSDPNVLEVLQRHFYYPFGMNMEGPWAMQDQAKNMYQYNGKELTDDLGLDWYFYGARMHDAAIGRFTGVDPIAERFAWVSTYNYAENSPVTNVDLWGLQASWGFLFHQAKVKVSNAADVSDRMIGSAESIIGEKLPLWAKATIYSNQFIDEFGTFSDQNDMSVLFNGQNMDGSEANSTDKIFATVGLAIPLVPGSTVRKLTKGLDKYEVGDFDNLKKRSEVGDGYDIHHVPQKKPASQAIDGYDGNTAPAIALPHDQHKQIPTSKGTYNGTARDQLARDAKNLRNVGVPNEKVQEVIDYNKKKYPDAYKKKE